MKTRLTLTASLVALLAGCGGAQSAAIPQALSAKVQAQKGSWMLPEAKDEALLYVAELRDILVYSYPGLKHVGQLEGLGDVNIQGLCVDKDGNVFVPAWGGGSPPTGYVYEYAHGGTQPIATLDDPGALSTSCSVDRLSEDLAVTNVYQSGYGDGNVAIYQDAKGNPTNYIVPGVEPQWAAYDESGNLFVDGYPYSNDSALAVLPDGSSVFKSVTLNKSIGMFSLQWVAGYLAVASAASKSAMNVYRVHISGSSGKVVGDTVLDIRRVLYGGNGQYWIQGYRILGAGSEHRHLSMWRYPAGGRAQKVVGTSFRPWGVVVSLAPATSAQFR